MITLLRTTASHPAFRKLTALLDEYLALRNGVQHDFYSRFNTIDTLAHCVVAMCDGSPAGCGAVRPMQDARVEIERMVVLPEYRCRGIGASVLAELERWAGELGYSSCILETGIGHDDAVGLYRKAGYIAIPNYGPYAGVSNSLCMEKQLTS